MHLKNVCILFIHWSGEDLETFVFLFFIFQQTEWTQNSE